MGEAHTFGPPADESEFAALLRVQGESFRMDEQGCRRYRSWLGDGNFRVVRDAGGAVVAGLAVYPMGQWFGGRSVPSWGVAAVATAPEARGAGAAGAAMRGLVREMHGAGVALSSLYPATVPLYRKSGYEHAGGRYEVEVRLDTLGVLPGPMPVRRLDPDSPEDAARVKALHVAHASARPGSLERGEGLWRRIRERAPGPVRGYLIGPDRDPRGYVFLASVPTRAPSWADSDLVVRDWAALDAEAGRRLWALIGSHAAQVERARLGCAPYEPLLSLLPEQHYTLRLGCHWMLRVVDVPAALEARGYPASVRGELVIEVDDDLLDANRGPWTLRVEGGRGTVSRGGSGGIALGVRALAPLYTGFHDAHALRALGWLSGDDAQVGTARALFSGLLPSMTDAF